MTIAAADAEFGVDLRDRGIFVRPLNHFQRSCGAVFAAGTAGFAVNIGYAMPGIELCHTNAAKLLLL